MTAIINSISAVYVKNIICHLPTGNGLQDFCWLKVFARAQHRHIAKENSRL